MKIYNFIARNVMAPSLDLLRGTKTMKCLRELERSQWWPRDKIMELQNQRLRQLVRYAYDNVPYYRRVFDERGLKPNDVETSRDLVKLPALTKQIIRANFDDLTARGSPAKERVKLSTAGSTGEPLVFYSTRHDHVTLNFAARQRAYSGIGLNLGDKYATFMVCRYQHEPVAHNLWQKPISFFRRIIFIDSQEMSPPKMPLIARKVERCQPEFIKAPASALYQLALFTQREGKANITPRAIINGGDQLYDFQRDLFREVFRCDTYDCYGSQEQHLIAFECLRHSGYHIVAENCIVEVVDDKDKPVPAGEKGRILITNLHNYAMPFIRYDIGDVGVASDSACPCGRGLPLLDSISGRTCDFIVTKNMGAIPGYPLLRLGERLFAPLGVGQFQIVQETYEKVVVKLVLGKGAMEKDMGELSREIIKEYKRILGEDMDIIVEFVDQIPSTAGGKRRVVISNLLQENSGRPSG